MTTEKLFASVRARLFNGTAVHIDNGVADCINELILSGADKADAATVDLLCGRYKPEAFSLKTDPGYNSTAAWYYTARYMSSYLPKIYQPLLNLAESGYFDVDGKIRLTVLDIGCGTGTFFFGIVSFFETMRAAAREEGIQCPDIEVIMHCVDSNHYRLNVLATNKKLIIKRWGSRYDFQPKNENLSNPKDIKSAAYTGLYHLVLCGHMINEMTGKDRDLLADYLASLKTRTDHLILIEPSDMSNAEMMMSFVNGLVQKGFVMMDPCPLTKTLSAECLKCWNHIDFGKIDRLPSADLSRFKKFQPKTDVKFIYSMMRPSSPEIREKINLGLTSADCGKLKIVGHYEDRVSACYKKRIRKHLNQNPEAAALPGDYIDYSGDKISSPYKRQDVFRVPAARQKPTATLSAVTQNDIEIEHSFLEMMENYSREADGAADE